VSVCVAVRGDVVYRRRATVRRAPASNEKLLLSMALLDRLGPSATLPTTAEASHVHGSTVRGSLWIRGSGDPEVDRGRMRALARRLKAEGIRRVKGRVMGSIPPFAHDWWAPGWKRWFPEVEVARPTALTFEGNTARGRNIADPERRAAASLTAQLRSAGVRVRGKPGAGRPRAPTHRIATVASAPLEGILRRQNVKSRNFYAEVLGKVLGERRFGPPGTIRDGARALEAWTRSHGVRVEAHDGSGLSYRDRVTAAGVVRLLAASDAAPWGDDLRSTLARGGQGTLGGRLHTVDVRAKTGTLSGISALSGWVRLQRTGGWAEFSILSRGISKTTAIRIEDRVVRAVAANAP
jgi:D-alanyl-D-alanine carboxypeptidase/D-alanyl-D-alanine-endopeptidase (penicillin-binding protein 4)